MAENILWNFFFCGRSNVLHSCAQKIWSQTEGSVQREEQDGERSSHPAGGSSNSFGNKKHYPFWELYFQSYRNKCLPHANSPLAASRISSVEEALTQPILSQGPPPACQTRHSLPWAQEQLRSISLPRTKHSIATCLHCLLPSVFLRHPTKCTVDRLYFTIPEVSALNSPVLLWQQVLVTSPAGQLVQ